MKFLLNMLNVNIIYSLSSKHLLLIPHIQRQSPGAAVPSDQDLSHLQSLIGASLYQRHLIGSTFCGYRNILDAADFVDEKFLGSYLSAQNKNRYKSGIVRCKVGILTLLRKVGILTLRTTIPEIAMCKVRIGTE